MVISSSSIVMNPFPSLSNTLKFEIFLHRLEVKSLFTWKFLWSRHRLQSYPSLMSSWLWILRNLSMVFNFLIENFSNNRNFCYKFCENPTYCSIPIFVMFFDKLNELFPCRVPTWMYFLQISYFIFLLSMDYPQQYKYKQENCPKRCVLFLLFTHGPWGKNSTPRKEAQHKGHFFSCFRLWLISYELQT